VRGGRAALRHVSRHTDLLALVGLTAAALALRLPLVDQSLTLDEPHSWVIAKGGFGDIFRELRAGYEIHPPLYFVLAWLAGKVGDPATWVRMPSLVLGTACVPLAYALGLRTVGRSAAAAGAALLAISPFAIHYSTDARPYAVLMFFCLASTLALVVAVESGRARWWALYALMACAALYTHYFAAFVLVAQAGWVFALARGHRRAYVLSCAAVAAGYLPWVPSILDQPHTTSDYAGLVPLSLSWLGK
jgi:mannosyltransferase